MSEFVSENILRWYRHVRMMDESKLVKRIYVTECSKRRIVEDQEGGRWKMCLTLREKDLTKKKTEKIAYNKNA